MADLDNVTEDPENLSLGVTGNAESDFLSGQGEALAKVQVALARQRLRFRRFAFIVALLVMVAAGILEWKLLEYIRTPCSQADDLFVLLAISPIASITLILIFVLNGVFRGFRESDLKGLPLETAGKAAFGGDS